MNSGPTHCEIGKDDLLADQRGELAEAESAQLATHVSDCPVCREEKDEMVRTAGLFVRLPEVIPSTDSWSRMLVKIEDVRNAEEEAPAVIRRRLFSLPSALKLVLPLAAALIRSQSINIFDLKKYICTIPELAQLAFLNEFFGPTSWALTLLS